MKNMLKKWAEGFKKDERGMTLVELLAVVVILGIVGLIAFVSIGNVIENAKKDAHVANAMQVISAAELFEASGGEIPADGIVASNDVFDTISGSELIDPWNNDFTGATTGEDKYDFTISKDGDVIRISSDHASCKFGETEGLSKVDLAEGRSICNK